MAWELCKREDVVRIHPTTVTELPDEFSEWVEDLIREELGEPYLGTSAVITNEYHNGQGDRIIKVYKPPIISVQGVYVNDVIIASASDYLVERDRIALINGGYFPQGFRNVKIDYTSGSATVPKHVQLTAAAMIVAILNYRKRYGADSSIKWGTAEPKAGEDTPNLNVGLTSHLKTIMKRTLKRHMLLVG